jgi:ribosomal 30S subunit maturation factor RimM
MSNLDDDWANFLSNDDGEFGEFYDNDIENTSLEESKEEIIPKCSDLYISTKTVISYLNKNNIDIKTLFWKIPIISYATLQEGIIKKQIKFATNDKNELEDIQQKLADIPFYEEQIIEHIDNPTGRIKFKAQRKISIGLCKKDILSYRSKKKRAFFNCFVLIFRIYDNEDESFKEMHVKVFNTGKLEIPGVQSDQMLNKIINMLVVILRPLVGDDLNYNASKNQTVLINSNFNCGYYIDRDKFHDILKYKYRINSSFDSCSYPGIQCKFYYIMNNSTQTGVQPETMDNALEISFMIFRTGSILIVGKCEQYILEEIYEKLKTIIHDEYNNISMGNINSSIVKSSQETMKKIRRKVITLNT